MPAAPVIKSATEKIWDLLSSMRFAIWVLVAAALFALIALVLSELLPQNLLHSAVAGFLKLGDPFQSWWFRLLLGLISLSLLVCIIDRAPVLLKQAFVRTFRTEKVHYLGQPGAVSFECSNGEETVRQLGSETRMKFHRKQIENGLAFVSVSGGISRLGQFLNHVGMLLLLIGGLAIGITGHTTRVGGGAGDVIREEEWDFSLRINDFVIRYYPIALNQWVETPDGTRGRVTRLEDDEAEVTFASHGDHEIKNSYPVEELDNGFITYQGGRAAPYTGNVKSYITSATVIEGDSTVRETTIEVNKPLRHNGFRFYQSSFELRSAQTSVDSVEISCMLDDEEHRVTLPVSGGKADLPWGGYTVSANRFFPDFKLDRQMRAYSASGEMRNPAVELIVSKGNEPPVKQWVFTHEMGGAGHSKSDISFQLVDARGVHSQPTGYNTILQVNREQGSWLIWAGFVIMTVGLLLAYSFSYRVLWALVEKAENKPDKVLVSSAGTRDIAALQEQISTFARAVK